MMCFNSFSSKSMPLLLKRVEEKTERNWLSLFHLETAVRDYTHTHTHTHTHLTALFPGLPG